MAAVLQGGSTYLDDLCMSSKEILATVLPYNDDGYITDDQEDPYPPVHVSPCMFASFAEGCKRWDDDPDKPETPDVPEVKLAVEEPRSLEGDKN